MLTWGLAFTSGQRLPTFRVARARRIYVIGRGMYLRRMSPREVAILMGMELCTYVHAAQRLFPLASQDDWLHGMIVDSIDFRMVGTLLDNGFEMRAFEDQYIRYGSLFSGGCEAMVNGFRRRRMQVDHVMAVEIEDRRRDVLRETSRPTFLFKEVLQVADLARRGAPLGRIDWLHASPPCRKASSGNTTSQVGNPQVEAEAREYFAAIMAVAEATGALYISIEQTEGLKSRHPQAFRAAWDELERTGKWRWRFGVVDVGTLGAAHNRKRIGWIGVVEEGAAGI